MILNGILWILATGAPWRDLPAYDGPWSTIANHFYAWQHNGRWNQLFTALQHTANACGDIDWSLHFVAGTVIRAHQHAAGARQGGGDEAVGRSKGGFSTKLHLRAEGQDKPLVILLTAGQRHERVDRAAYRERNRVERTINRLKQFRRGATRYEKRAVNYLAMVLIAVILLWP